MARGLFLETLPACPERCGGQGACLDRLTQEQKAHRTRHGCDEPIPEDGKAHYAIRCPACDGAAAHGADCESCSQLPGFKVMRRCPATYGTYDVMRAIQVHMWMDRGLAPSGSSFADQPIAFTEFVTTFEREKSEVLEEQRKEG